MTTKGLKEDGGRNWYRLAATAVVALCLLALVVGASGTVAAQEQVDDCTILTEGTHELTDDIDADDSCITLSGDAVLDGNGHSITGPGADEEESVGITVADVFDPIILSEDADDVEPDNVIVPFDVQIKNVTVTGFETGIEFDGASDSEATDIQVRSTGTAVSINGSDNVAVEDSTLGGGITAGGTDRGVVVEQSEGTVLSGNTVNAVPTQLDPIDPDPILSESVESLSSHEDGISLSNTEGSVVENNGVVNFDGSGIFLTDTEDAVVNGNTVEDNTDGIRVGFSSGVEVSENDVTENEDAGINLGAGAENVVEDNFVADNGGDGVLIEPASTPVATFFPAEQDVTGNDVVGNDGSGVALVSLSEGEVSENEVSENNERGVVLVSSEDVLVESNEAVDNGNNGIRLEGGSEGNELTDNEVVENTITGILLESSDQNDVTDNEVTDNAAGITLLDSSDGNDLVGNDVNENSDGIRLFESSDNTLTDNTAKDNENTDFSVSDSPGTNVENLGIGDSTAPETTLSFEAEDVSLSAVDDPEDAPDDLLGIDRYFEAESLSDDAFLNVELGYEDSDIAGVDESTLGLWKHDGTDWTEVSVTDVDTTENVVTAEITEFSDFGAFGEEDEAEQDGLEFEIDGEADEVTVEMGETVGYTATATFDDGSEVDVTDDVTVTSDDVTVASVDQANNEVTGQNEGTVDVEAEHDGFTDTVEVTVEEEVDDGFDMDDYRNDEGRVDTGGLQDAIADFLANEIDTGQLQQVIAQFIQDQ